MFKKIFIVLCVGFFVICYLLLKAMAALSGGNGMTVLELLGFGR